MIKHSEQAQRQPSPLTAQNNNTTTNNNNNNNNHNNNKTEGPRKVCGDSQDMESPLRIIQARFYQSQIWQMLFNPWWI